MAKPLPAIQLPRSLADEAAELVRDRIFSGDLPRGERLVEARLAEQLGVSRGPVREALQMLRAEGLVQEEPRKGMFVVSPSEDDVRDIYAVRAAIEGRAARILAREREPAVLAELDRTIDELEAAAKSGDARAVNESDLALHEAICRLTGNRRLHRIFLETVPILRTLLKLDEALYSSHSEVVGEHRAIVDAIKSGDGEAADKRTEAHFERACELLVDYLAASATESEIERTAPSGVAR